jgi:hypothetical protein
MNRGLMPSENSTETHMLVIAKMTTVIKSLNVVISVRKTEMPNEMTILKSQGMSARETVSKVVTIMSYEAS